MAGIVTSVTKARSGSSPARPAITPSAIIDPSMPRPEPRAAAQRGIADGDVVRLFNERGACLAGAVIDDGLMPEVVQLSTGAWYDPDETGMCRAGNPNVLTADVGTSRLAQGPSAHTCLVDVERFEGEAPRVEAYDPPEVLPLLSRGD